MALGIDIYRKFQTVTDWPAVKRHGIAFVYVKLTDGGGIAPGGPGDNEVRGANSVGIPAGGYHFVQASPSPEAQAELFIAEVRRTGATGLVPMLDLEDNPPGSGRPNIPDNQKRDFAIRFCNRVAARGFRPGVYMNNSLAKALRPDQWGVPGLAVWIARYGRKPDAAAGRYDLHQYSDAGQVPGIRASSVDLNESYTTAHFNSAPQPGGGGATPAPDPGSQEEYVMNRIDCKAIPSNGFAELALPGGARNAITIYPGKEPVWLGAIYFWGEGHKRGNNQTGGVGGNPSPDPDAIKVDTIRTFEAPDGALLAQLDFSSNSDFFVVGKG